MKNFFLVLSLVILASPLSVFVHAMCMVVMNFHRSDYLIISLYSLILFLFGSVTLGYQVEQLWNKEMETKKSSDSK